MIYKFLDVLWTLPVFSQIQYPIRSRYRVQVLVLNFGMRERLISGKFRSDKSWVPSSTTTTQTITIYLDQWRKIHTCQGEKLTNG